MEALGPAFGALRAAYALVKTGQAKQETHNLLVDAASATLGDHRVSTGNRQAIRDGLDDLRLDPEVNGWATAMLAGDDPDLVSPQLRARVGNLLNVRDPDVPDDVIADTFVEALQDETLLAAQDVKTALRIVYAEIRRSRQEGRSRDVAGDGSTISLGPDAVSQLAAAWVEKAGLAEWERNISNLLTSGWPQLYRDDFEALRECRTWLFGRHFPDEQAPRFSAEIRNFLSVLNVLLSVLDRHRDPTYPDDELISLDRVKPATWVSEEEFEIYRRSGEFLVDLVEDLAFELTRAGNAVIEAVRRDLDQGFQEKAGALTVTRGPTMDLQFKTYRPEYRDSRRFGRLEDFYADRATRDVHVGTGPPPDPSVRLRPPLTAGWADDMKE